MVNLSDKENIIKLMHRNRHMLQVLLPEFRLEKQQNGCSLKVQVTGEMYSLISQAGKREFFAEIEKEGKDARRELSKQLSNFFNDRNLIEYRFNCTNAPFRYANGGVLPIVRLNSSEYFCLFYRDIFPVGWNTANGGSDNLEELLNPERLIYREFGEELLISDDEKRLIYAYEPGSEDTSYGLQSEPLEVWKLRFKDRDLNQYHKLPLPVKWVEGPDSVIATIGKRKYKSVGYFLNINPEDNGIEVDKIALINLKDKVNFFDGEVSQGILCNRIVGLFSVNAIAKRFKNNKLTGNEFLPDKLFFDGKEWSVSDITRIIEEECLPSIIEIRTERDRNDYRNELNKFKLCPVTHTIIRRYFKWVEHELDRTNQLTSTKLKKELGEAGKSQIFIAFNSADTTLACDLHNYLTDRGHIVFCSAVSMQQLGESDYFSAMGRALESATCLIVLGTHPDFLDSGWVGLEWKSFMAEIYSKRKPNGKIFTFVSDIVLPDLPILLRPVESIEYKPSEREESYEKLYRFIAQSLA